MSSIVNKIEEILKSEYSVQNYVELMTEILDGLKIIAPNFENRNYPNNYALYIKHFSHIGTYNSPDKKKIIVMAVELKKLSYVENSRSAQRSLAKWMIENNNADAALIAFYTEGVGMWRLSFVRLDYEMKIENGKLKTAENMTPARRYSFLVGKDEPCHTAIDRFRLFIESRSTYPTLDDLENAFSVEAVTKEFFDLYCDKFIQLRNHLENSEDFITEATLHNYTSAQFAKKLMGQIVFLYFLQKKGWLGVKAWPRQMSATEYKKAFYARGARSRELIPQLYLQMDDNTYRLSAAALQSLSDEDETFLSTCVRGEAWGTGPHNFMRKLFEEAARKGANFFDDYLEPLFYDVLNVNRGEQGYDPALHCRIPFLSGGLFEPIDGYDWKHNNFGIPNEIFSNRDGDKDRLADGILDIFDRYNFTMSEDEPMEREVAIDPEMLVKVFENLLDITDRKSKGAFYTPREIVHYMCQESLINYLTNTMKVKEMSIRDFILYGDLMRGEDANVLNRALHGDSYDLWISEELYLLDKDGSIVVDRMAELDKALQDVRIADPAVGSGAFPLGMLNEIVRARQNITTYMGLTLKIRNPKGAATQIMLMHMNDRAARQLKYETIRNCIFAADIEPSAVDIAQLRLWLSLVIDDEINPDATSILDGYRNPLPLPNLECNIFCGNSLIDEFEGMKLINESDIIGTAGADMQVNLYQNAFDTLLNKLIEKQEELFRCDDTEKKYQILQDISALRDEVIMSQLRNTASAAQLERYEETKKMASKPYVLWQLDFAKVFREKGGFDIVIGNPPYIGFHKVPDKEYHRAHFYSANGKYDFYVLFIERALQLVHDSGFISYICPSYFYKRNYGKNIRELILNNTSIRYIADFSDYQIFDTALTYTCIFGISKIVEEDNTIVVLNKSLSLLDSHKIKQNGLSEPTWLLGKPSSNGVIEKVQKNTAITFGQITKSISQGIVSGNNDVYLIENEIIDQLGLEKELLKPAYKGKDICNGKLLSSPYMIFYPYHINEKGNTVVISEEQLMATAPNLYNYLVQRKDILLSREYFVKSKKKWYELWNPRKMEHFYHRKFVFSEIGYVNDFIIVDECFYMDSVCGAELLASYSQYEGFIQRYLNSKLATYIYKKISVPKANGYSIYKNAFLKSLPILLPAENIGYTSMTDDEFTTYLVTIQSTPNNTPTAIPRNAATMASKEETP